MELASLKFVAFAIIAVVVMTLLPSRPVRQWLLLALNLAFVGSFAQNPEALAPLAVFMLIGFVCLKLIDRVPLSQVAAGAAILIILVFIYLKQYSIADALPDLPFVYVFFGVSYILFRMLHLVIDRYQEAIDKPVTALSYVNYLLYFPAFVSGPIQRYQDFTSAEHAGELSDDDVFRAVSRILSGFLKTILLSPIFLMVFDHLMGGGGGAPDGLGLIPMVVYGFAAAAFYIHFYLSFQGYMDVVIGLSILLGIRLPENFNSPFSARNFLDFWTRWHITLADWFRTYLFNPLLKLLIQLTGWTKGANYLAVLAFFVTFLVMGLWHGTSQLWFVYGIFLAAGVSTNKFYQVVAASVLGRAGYGALCANRFYSALSLGMTFAYVSLAFGAFWPDQGKNSLMTGEVDAAGAVIAFSTISVIITTVSLLFSPWFPRLLTVLADRLSTVNSLIFRNFWLAAKLLIIIGASLLVSAIPETVYKPF